MQPKVAEDFTRRGFLKATTAVSAAALATNFATNYAYAAVSETIKVGLVGCGGRGSGAAMDNLKGAEQIKAKSEIYAVGDVFPEPAKRAQDKHKVPSDRVFVGLDAYKAVIDSGIDMVILATPPGFRPRHFRYAVEKGRNIFFEKPVAVDPTGVRIVLEAAELADKKGLKVVTGTQRRHQTNYNEAIKQIHGGAIGDVLHMSVYWNGQGIWNRPRQPGMSDVEAQIHNWYHYVWLCGDQIVEQHIHNLDIANWVMNSPPISAYALGGRQVRKTPGHIWDHFAVEYEYPNGARCMSMCRHWGQSDDKIGEFALGSNGSVNFADSTVSIQVKGAKKQNLEREVSGYVQEHADLLKCLIDNKPINEAKRIAETTLTAIMGRMSAYTGRKIYWDKAAAAAANNPKAYTAMESKLDTWPGDNLNLKGTLPEPEVAMPDRDDPI